MACAPYRQSNSRDGGDGRGDGAVAWALAPATRFGHTAGNLIIVGGAGLAAVLVYGALMVILRVQELDLVKQLIGSKRLA